LTTAEPPTDQPPTSQPPTDQPPTGQPTKTVLAALRFVDQRATVDPLTGAVRTDERTSGPSEADRCALEHALRLAARLGGRCVAVTVGPPAADAMLRDALAAGADAVLRIQAGDPDADHDHLDEAATADALIDGFQQRYGLPDLVICGDHSADRGAGSTPAYLAHRLGAAQALGLLELAQQDGELRALRRIDGGRRERLAVGLPAVCSVEPTTVRLRRAALPAVLAARTATVPVVTTRQRPPRAPHTGPARPYRPRPRVLPAPVGDDPRTRVLALTGALVEREPPRVVTPASAAEAADELLGFLRQHGYLDDEAR
jgi:electron transfer flavoprotein beta subunit